VRHGALTRIQRAGAGQRDRCEVGTQKLEFRRGILNEWLVVRGEKMEVKSKRPRFDPAIDTATLPPCLHMSPRRRSFSNDRDARADTPCV
jgi:hypothetical protein